MMTGVQAAMQLSGMDRDAPIGYEHSAIPVTTRT
jgi:hypothetical protein